MSISFSPSLKIYPSGEVRGLPNSPRDASSDDDAPRASDAGPSLVAGARLPPLADAAAFRGRRSDSARAEDVAAPGLESLTETGDYLPETAAAPPRPPAKGTTVTVTVVGGRGAAAVAASPRASAYAVPESGLFKGRAACGSVVRLFVDLTWRSVVCAAILVAVLFAYVTLVRLNCGAVSLLPPESIQGAFYACYVGDPTYAPPSPSLADALEAGNYTIVGLVLPPAPPVLANGLVAYNAFYSLYSLLRTPIVLLGIYGLSAFRPWPRATVYAVGIASLSAVLSLPLMPQGLYHVLFIAALIPMVIDFCVVSVAHQVTDKAVFVHLLGCWVIIYAIGVSFLSLAPSLLAQPLVVQAVYRFIIHPIFFDACSAFILHVTSRLEGVAQGTRILLAVVLMAVRSFVARFLLMQLGDLTAVAIFNVIIQMYLVVGRIYMRDSYFYRLVMGRKASLEFCASRRASDLRCMEQMVNTMIECASAISVGSVISFGLVALPGSILPPSSAVVWGSVFIQVASQWAGDLCGMAIDIKYFGLDYQGVWATRAKTLMFFVPLSMMLTMLWDVVVVMGFFCPELLADPSTKQGAVVLAYCQYPQQVSVNFFVRFFYPWYV